MAGQSLAMQPGNRAPDQGVGHFFKRHSPQFRQQCIEIAAVAADGMWRQAAFGLQVKEAWSAEVPPWQTQSATVDRPKGP